MKVLVWLTNPMQQDHFDQLLWIFSAGSFVPHCQIGETEQMIRFTPIVLTTELPKNHNYDVLINLNAEKPPDLGLFKRVIEIAGITPEDKIAARERYRFYQNAGYPLQHHKLD